ncbi:hypothetical protein SDC9_170628 [bioreactor metagenome]|uniref:Uncharacterized protein n=1 Tax=bioreactor metagenome TaxID=1076179 RepID=A0A645GB27_9ZZZZ
MIFVEVLPSGDAYGGRCSLRADNLHVIVFNRQIGKPVVLGGWLVRIGAVSAGADVDSRTRII